MPKENRFTDILQRKALAEAYIQENYGSNKSKLSGFGFWVILLIAVIKEFIDGALTATLIFSLLVSAISLVFGFIIWFYLIVHDVKMDTRKVATMFVSIIIEIIPILSIMPTFPFTLLILRAMDASDLKRIQKESEEILEA